MVISCGAVAWFGSSELTAFAACAVSKTCLDVGRYGVIDFGHIGFVVCGQAVIGLVREDELVGCCAHHRARDIGRFGEC